jgi:hypothetical protein
MRCSTIFSLLWLSACGARPQEVVAVGVPSWQSGFGGAYLHGCLASETIWLSSVHRVYRFEAQPNMPPRLVSTHPVINGLRQTKAVSRSCHANGYKLSYTDGRTHVVGVEPPPPKSWVTSQPPLSSKAVSFSLGPRQSLAVSHRGWVFRQDGRNADWRRVSAEIRDAILKDDTIWMISDDGLWRVSLASRRISPISLPAIFDGSPFKAIFQDGSALWIKTEANKAWPLMVRGNYAIPAGRGGPVEAPPLLTSLPMGDGHIEWSRPGGPLRYRGADGRSITPLAAVDALLPLGSRRLLVGTPEGIEFWTFDGPHPTRLSRMQPGGRTARFFWKGDELVAVGRNYGVWLGRLIQKR